MGVWRATNKMTPYNTKEVTTALNESGAEDFTVAGGGVELFAEYTNLAPWDAVREIVSNGYDQYNNKDVKKFNLDPIIRIIISKHLKKFIVEDFATGILNLALFKIFGNEADNPIGKIVDEDGQYSKDSTGMFHIAKAAFRSLSKDKRVWFHSNNGHEGHILRMGPKQWETIQVFEKSKGDDITKALNHKGMKITIIDPIDEILSITKLKNNLAKWFGILLKRKNLIIKIVDLDNEQKGTINITAPTSLKTKEEAPLFSIGTGESKIRITGDIDKIVEMPKENNIDIYRRHIFIQSLQFDYLAKGWINCDDLSITTSRSAVKYDDLTAQITKELNDHFEREGFDKYDRHHGGGRLRGLKQLEEIANNGLSAYFKLNPFYDNMDLTGTPKDQHPENPDEGEGEPINIMAPKEKRNTDVDSQPGTVKPTGTGPPRVNVNTEDEETTVKSDKRPHRSNITIQGGQMGIHNKSVYFAGPENLFINYDRRGGAAIKAAGDQNRTRLFIVLAARAIINLMNEGKNIDNEERDQKYEALLDKMLQGIE